MSYRVQKYLLILMFSSLFLYPSFKAHAEDIGIASRNVTKTNSTALSVDGSFIQNTVDFTFPGDINFGELITDIEVSVTFDTEFASDVYYILTAPSGTQITLIEGLQNEGGTNEGPTYSGITTSPVTISFRQSACQPVGGEPESGTYRPVESLKSLIGENPTGTWSLTIGDSKALGDTLEHGSFSISLSLGAFCTLEATAIIDQQVSCAENLDGKLSVDIQGGVAPFSYQWCHGPITDSLSGLGAGTYTVAVTDFLGCTALSSVKLQDPDSLGVVIAVVDSISCKGLSDAILEANPIGGTAPFSYEWSLGDTTARLEDLSIGTYRVTLTDAQGCQGVAEENLTEPDELLLSLAVLAEPSCRGTADGILEGIVSGGIPPYRYSWSHGDSVATASTLLSGSYKLKITDNNGCGVEDSLILSANDLISPIAQCQDLNVYLNAQGWALLSPEMIDNGSSDFCGIASYAVDIDSFTCAELGANTVTLTVTDSSGNVQTCTSQVTVIDSIAPTIVSCPSDIQVATNPGTCGATVSWIEPISTDNCDSVSVNATHQPGASFSIGTTTVTYTATDPSGNTSSCSFKVTVADDEKPTLVCTDFTLYLDALGTASLNVSDVDGGSTDNCELTSLTVSRTSFSCSDIGIQSIWLIGEDASGNRDSCSAQVTVQDTLSPVLACRNRTVYLDAFGQTTISPQDLVEAVTDPCGISELSVSNGQFTCEDIGVQAVTLTAIDTEGNRTTCTAQVTVQDTLSPIVTCTDITRYLDENGQLTVDANEVGESASDNCGIPLLSLNTTQFNCSDLGSTTIELTATDASGNTSSCTAQLTLRDTLAPMVVCQNLTRYLDENGQMELSADEVDAGSSDNCEIVSYSLSQTSFSCADLGES
ncbi:MAG: HYR domain-containing protein, partial [Bacteroidota bacterium]